MDTKQMEQKVIEMVKEQGWVLKPYEDLCGIMEELGEVCREVRRYEAGRQRPDEVEPKKEIIREHMAEEIGDMLFPLIKVATYYGITLEEAFHNHLAKMKQRYKEVGEKE